MKLSYSKIRCFKECRKKYFFKYIEQVPVPRGEALIVGSNYHEALRLGYSDNPKIDAMIKAFQRYIKLPKLIETEKKFDVDIGGVWLTGYIDGITENGVPVEHKTCGYKIDESYINKLNWDEQVTTYLLAMQTTKMIYTVVQKPTIRQTKKETIDEYHKRVYEWYDESKTKMFPVVRSELEINSWRQELILLAKEMENCKHFYRNPMACKLLGCEYSDFCLDYGRENLK